MPILYPASQAASGPLAVAPINAGVSPSIEILNYSQFFLSIATEQAGATNTSDPSFVMTVEPWQGVQLPLPKETRNTMIYVGVPIDTATQPISFADANLPGVLYQLLDGLVTPFRWQLLPASALSANGASINTTIANTVDANITNATVNVSGTTNANITNASVPVNGDVNATIQNASISVKPSAGAANFPISGTVNANITNATVPVNGSVDANITNATLNATLGSGSEVIVNSGTVNIGKPIQTVSAVLLGSVSLSIKDLANTESQSAMMSGITSGYFETIILEGQSANGYTYIPSATPYNRSTALTAPSVTTNQGPNGEFYSEGTVVDSSSNPLRQLFSNVSVSLQAQVTSASTIFTDAMTSGTDWTTQAGSVAYSSSGATFGATPTTLLENTLTGLEPQNLTLQAGFKVVNTNTPTAGDTQIPATTNATAQTDTCTAGQSFTVSQSITITQIGYGAYNGSVSKSGLTAQIGLWDNSGTLLASASLTTVQGASNLIFTIPSVTLTPGNTYWIGYYSNGAYGYGSGTANTSGVTQATLGNVVFTFSTTFLESSTAGLTSPNGGSQLGSAQVVTWYFGGTYIVGSHSTIGVEYQNASDTYYEVEWSGTSLNLVKDDAGTVTTLATTTVTNETDTSVTLKLVVASNGNLTGTLKGAATNTVTATDTTITSGQMAVTGDSGVIASNALITGNYIPSDTVTVDVYAT